MGTNPPNGTILKHLITWGSGSVGPITVQSNQYGIFQRLRPGAQAITTAPQAAWRATLKAIAVGWGSLTRVERAAWNNYAIGPGKVYAKRVGAGLSGSALWTGMNALRQQVGGTPVTMPPGPGGRPAMPVLEAVVATGPGTVSMLFRLDKPPLAPGTGDWCNIMISKPRNYSAKGTITGWQVAGKVDSFYAGTVTDVTLNGVTNAVLLPRQRQKMRIARTLPDGRYSIYSNSDSYPGFVEPVLYDLYPKPWDAVMDVGQTLTGWTVDQSITGCLDTGPGIAGFAVSYNGDDYSYSITTTAGWVGPYTTTLAVSGPSGVELVPLTVVAGSNPYGFVGVPYTAKNYIYQGWSDYYNYGTVTSLVDPDPLAPIGSYFASPNYIYIGVITPVLTAYSGVLTISGSLGTYYLPYTIPVQGNP